MGVQCRAVPLHELPVPLCQQPSLPSSAPPLPPKNRACCCCDFIFHRLCQWWADHLPLTFLLPILLERKDRSCEAPRSRAGRWRLPVSLLFGSQRGKTVAMPSLGLGSSQVRGRRPLLSLPSNSTAAKPPKLGRQSLWHHSVTSLTLSMPPLEKFLALRLFSIQTYCAARSPINCISHAHKDLGHFHMCTLSHAFYIGYIEARPEKRQWRGICNETEHCGQ